MQAEEGNEIKECIFYGQEAVKDTVPGDDGYQKNGQGRTRKDGSTCPFASESFLQVNHYKFENPAHIFSKPKEFSRELFCALISRLIYQSLFQAPQALSYRGIFLLERSL